MSVTREQVMEALSRIVDPASGKDLVSADIVRAPTIEDGKVRFVLEVDPERGKAMEPVLQAAIAAVERLTGPGGVSAVLTAHAAPAAPPDLKSRAAASKPEGPKPIPGVRSIIAVASGKGGVGKSTVSANLAAGLAAGGLKVGLLDADVYGPSQPRMMGTSERPTSPDGKTMRPISVHGVAMISLGLLMPEDEAAVWRGPMLVGALGQLLTNVAWGALDVLIVDLPPGTGDVQLSLVQKVPVTGAVIVSTPQDIALLDARKAISMFAKTGTPVLGMVENMSSYVCPNCGHHDDVFGHGGARADAERLGVPFLGEVPLSLSIRQAGDDGKPVVVTQPEAPQGRAFLDIATGVARAVGA